MEMKQNQTFFRITYSNLMLYFFVKKYLSIPITFKIKFLSFMTKVNRSNGNKTKSEILKGHFQI